MLSVGIIHGGFPSHITTHSLVLHHMAEMVQGEREHVNEYCVLYKICMRQHVYKTVSLSSVGSWIDIALRNDRFLFVIASANLIINLIKEIINCLS